MSDEVMHMLGEMKGMLAALLTRLDGFEQRHSADLQTVHHRIDKHDTRITVLETTSNRAQGMALATRIIVPLVWGLVLASLGGVGWLLTSGVADLIARAPKP
jgi:hypothetical protein